MSFRSDVDLGDAVVSEPAAFRVHPSVAVDLCAVAILNHIQVNAAQNKIKSLKKIEVNSA